MHHPHPDQHKRDDVLLDRFGVQGPDEQQTIVWCATFGQLDREPHTRYVLARHYTDVADRFSDHEDLFIVPVQAPVEHQVTLERTRGSQAEWDAWVARPDVTRWLHEQELVEAAIQDVASLNSLAKDRVRQNAIEEAFGKDQITLTAFGQPGATQNELHTQWAPTGPDITVVDVTERGPVQLRPALPPALAPDGPTDAPQALAPATASVRAASFPNTAASRPTPTPTGPAGLAHARQPTQEFGR